MHGYPLSLESIKNKVVVYGAKHYDCPPSCSRCQTNVNQFVGEIAEETPFLCLFSKYLGYINCFKNF